jgi:hypothetical protein
MSLQKGHRYSDPRSVPVHGKLILVIVRDYRVFKK